MRVLIRHLQDRGQTELGGETPADVRRKLLARFPWLARAGGATMPLDALLERLDAMQGYSVRVAEAAPESVRKREDPYAAAQWMTGRDPLGQSARRAATYAADGDEVGGAIRAYALSDTPETRDSIRAFHEFTGGGQSAIRNPQSADDTRVPQQEVSALVHQDGGAAADAVRRAFAAGQVTWADLGGKHSAGSMLARDPEGTGTLLLKPGAGDSPILGEDQDPAGEGRREAAFWHLADAWGVSQWYPRADLLKAGAQEVAAEVMLPHSWRLLGELEQENPGFARRTLLKYLGDGVLYRWAAMDYIVGNGDRNSSNLMSDGPQVRLIDQGAAFAGSAFDPPRDRMSYVPYPLRCWAPTPYNSLPPGEKLRTATRLGRADEAALRGWLAGLDRDAGLAVMTRYGVRPGPTLDRLEKLRGALAEWPSDMAVMRAWVV